MTGLLVIAWIALAIASLYLVSGALADDWCIEDEERP